MIGAERIRELLPHRHPIQLVDRVPELVPGAWLRAEKAVTANEPWDCANGYPAALLIESWGQSAALLAALEQGRLGPGTVLLFGGMSKVRFHRPVAVGETLEHHVRIARDLGETVLFEGHTECAGQTVLEIGQAVLAFRPGAELN
ncbi:3-hydroxyacyl-ACP dehydratase FabZ family protein [Sciscionella marina]|uniref:3-hydroxyacyl-ACP dehydratase FabZ family protein n=1 Tax=Sciscionella marina TaxID=508770 RepID=UPI00036AE98D|nr:hypothetical protein [Sciscionella marina]